MNDQRIETLSRRYGLAPDLLREYRDPDQDFGFIRRVLEIEHRIIQGMKQKADIVVTGDYEVFPV